MQNSDAPKPLDELLEPGSTLMVGTRSGDGGEIESRPLTVAKVEGGRIDILLDTNEEWVRRMGQGDQAHVTLSDNRTNTWASFNGTVSTTTDPKLIDELWNPFAGSYFENGRETPGIAVLQIAAGDGSYWSGPGGGRLGSLLSVVKAKFGDAEQSGEHGEITT